MLASQKRTLYIVHGSDLDFGFEKRLNRCHDAGDYFVVVADVEDINHGVCTILLRKVGGQVQGWNPEDLGHDTT
jgi:hypothetical protein